jgi:hypothetical protein
MNRDADDLQLRKDLEAANREAGASVRTTRRVLARRSPERLQQHRERRLHVVGSFGVVAAAITWYMLRLDGPSKEDIDQGRDMVLKIAEQWTTDYVRRHGEAPRNLADNLPAARDVQVLVVTEGVRLSIEVPGSGEHSVIIPMRAGR